MTNWSLQLTFNFRAVGRRVGHGVAIGCETVAVLGLDRDRAQQRIRHQLIVQYNVRNFMVSIGVLAFHEPIGDVCR